MTDTNDRLPTGTTLGVGDTFVDVSAHCQYRWGVNGWEPLRAVGDPSWLLNADEVEEYASRAAATALDHAAELIRSHSVTIATNARDAHAAVELVAWMVEQMAVSERLGARAPFRP